MDVVAFVAARGGFATLAELRGAGLPARLLTELVTDGVLRRPRRGWYSTRERDDPGFRAVALGGRLTGVSAIAAWGGWIPQRSQRLHVAVPAKAFGVTRPERVVIHWHDDRRTGTTSSVDLEHALTRTALDEELETSVCAFDWALSTGRLDRLGFEVVLGMLPARMQVLRRWVDPRSQSVLESIARVRCLRRGWTVRSQVRVGDLQSIDLVIHDSVALELDGREFHESSFVSDRRKDLDITIEGRHALRIDSTLVFRHWRDVERAIEQALRARGRAANLGTPLAEPRGHRVRPRATLTSSEVADAASGIASAAGGCT